MSPVPLTATASGEHVLQATTYSKSVLRAVTGQLFHERDDVDYVPSYEVITSAVSRGQFFESNLRSVKGEGVEAVMRMFFAEDRGTAAAPKSPPAATADGELADPDSEDADEVVCEEALLEAFAS